MPRKNAQAKSASARTSAAIFNEPAPQPQPEPAATAIEAPAEASAEPPAEDARFPFNVLLDAVELVQERMTVQKGVQLMVCFYVAQIFYIHYKERDVEVVYAVGFSLMGALLAMYLSHRSLAKRHAANPERTARPALPSFNTVFSLFVPYSLVLLMSDIKDPFCQVNLSMANFCVKSLHPVAKVLSAFVYYYMFNDAATLEVLDFAKAVWVYFMVDYVLREWNVDSRADGRPSRASMDDTEIHLVALLLVNLLQNFRLPVSEATLPLVLVRILAIALLGACGAAFPLYYGRQKLADGALKSLVSYAVVAAYAATFYFLTEYLFKLQVHSDGAVSWLYHFVKASSRRTALLATWAAALAATLLVVLALAHRNAISLNSRRKVWHVALVACLAYPVVQEPVFVAIAVLGSVFVFVSLELLRCTRLTVLGDLLYSQMRVFQDEKDLMGPMNLSYIFLLVGVGVPIAYGVIYDDVVSIRSYLGLITLGVGDTLASVVGRRFGKVKWRNSSRTVEGTIVHIVSTFASFVAIDFYVLPEAARVQNWENLFIVVVIAGLLEGAATLNDNVLVPCVSLIAFEVLNKVFK